MELNIPWLGLVKRDLEIEVDYSQGPLLPNGAAKVIRHKPAANGLQTVGHKNLILERMPRGFSYDQYYEANWGRRLCDAMILDAIIAEILKDPDKHEHVFNQLFGRFTGQIFFLGTAFESTDGRYCVPYLNIFTYEQTRQSALRYICPSDHPVNHDVRSCACYLR